MRNKTADSAKTSTLLSPSVAAITHLFLIGLPLLWGITPLWDCNIHTWMGWDSFKNFSPASSIFNDRILSADGTFSSSLEAFAVHDMGWLFIYPYKLSLVAWYILRNSDRGMVHLHETLTECSFATVAFMTILQSVHPKWPYAPFEPNFYASVMCCHLLALAISHVAISSSRSMSGQELTTAQQYEEWRAESARWSIPGFALVSASTISALVVLASIQALLEKHKLDRYFDPDSVYSQIFMTSLFLGLFHLSMHAFLLYRLRYNIMEVNELRILCLYKFILNVMIPFFWLPEVDPLVHINKQLAFSIRLFLASMYYTGYRFAGLGDSFARILVGEQAI